MYRHVHKFPQENILLCIYVFELVVRLKRLGRDFFSCESPDLAPGRDDGLGTPRGGENHRKTIGK